MKNCALHSRYIEEKGEFDKKIEQMEAIDAILGKDDLSVSEAINALLQARKFGWDSTQMWSDVLSGVDLPVWSVSSTKGEIAVRLEYDGFTVLFVVYGKVSCNYDLFVILDDAPATFWYDSVEMMNRTVASIREAAQHLKEKYIDCDLSCFKIASLKDYHKELFSIMRSEWYDMAPDCHVNRKMLRSKIKRVRIVEEVIDNIMSGVDPLVARAEEATAAVQKLEVHFKALWPQVKSVLDMFEGTPLPSPRYGVYPENVANEDLNEGFKINEERVFSEVFGGICILNKPINAIIESMTE